MESDLYTRYKHVGVRPLGELTRDDSNSHKRRNIVYYEDLPDGGYRIWSEKTLKSGCGRTVTEVMRDGELIYCPYCKEWASEIQFKEVGR